MSRFRALLAALIAFALVAGPLGVPAQAGAAGDAPATASAKKGKKKCNKLKGKKKKRCLKKNATGNKKPWAGSPYKPGITCAMSPEMQKKYAKYGLTCIDLGLGVTTLDEL
jgi:hypothetical protein